MFVKERDFEKFANGKAVKSYNNPYIKCVDGEDVNIIPDGEKIVFKRMCQEDALYYIGYVGEEIWEGSTTISGWFPTELVCGVVGGMFNMKTDLAEKTGWIPTNGSFGSKNDAFKVSGLEEAARRLREAGFEVEIID